MKFNIFVKNSLKVRENVIKWVLSLNTYTERGVNHEQN
jgi:hypothetical protein